jgi:hypothetical protein
MTMSQLARTQRTLILHGALVLMIALLCGLPSVVEVSNGTGRMWQAAHSALLLLGVWIIASAAVFPLLELPKAEAAGLRWSLILAGYCFATAVILQAATGVRAFSPEGGILTKIAFAANLGAILTSFLAVALTLIGTANGLRADKHSARADRASDSTQRVGPSA